MLLKGWGAASGILYNADAGGDDDERNDDDHDVMVMTRTAHACFTCRYLTEMPYVGKPFISQSGGL